jgi:DNA-binding transcriptional ArsR family regulator
VDEISDEIGQSVANTSHHLRAMARAGLLSTRRYGGPYCVYADDAVRELSRRGYRAQRLEDGYPEWKQARLPAAGGDGG